MLVKLQSLNKTYRAAEVETTALRDVNVDIREGEFVAVMGPSGCGKSTLLNVIGMLDSPTSGAYLFKGEDIAKFDEAKLADLRKRNLGFVFQSFNLIDELTVEGNIELALLYQRDISSADRKRRVAEAMDRMKIAPPREALPGRAVGRSAAARRGRARGRRQAVADPRRRADRQPRLAARRGGDEAAGRAQRRRHDDRDGHTLVGARRVRAPHDQPVRRPRPDREPASGVMLRNYLTVALRNLVANKVNALINIGGLAVGLAACLTILLYVGDELSYERWLPNADRSTRSSRRSSCRAATRCRSRARPDR